MLSTSALQVRYGATLLEFHAMTLSKGVQCLITGASGVGKTTLLYALAGLLPVSQGALLIDGHDITKMSERARDDFRGRHIGVVYQGLHLVKSLTLLENVLLAAYAVGVKGMEARAKELLAALGLSEKMHALPEMVSQGQAQRVALARAVLHKPALLLADEPTSSLDDVSAETVALLLKDLAAACGSTLVIATHDARLRGHFAQEVRL